jgi:hypothetical protein
MWLWPLLLATHATAACVVPEPHGRRLTAPFTLLALTQADPLCALCHRPVSPALSHNAHCRRPSSWPEHQGDEARYPHDRLHGLLMHIMLGRRATAVGGRQRWPGG